MIKENITKSAGINFREIIWDTIRVIIWDSIDNSILNEFCRKFDFGYLLDRETIFLHTFGNRYNNGIIKQKLSKEKLKEGFFNNFDISINKGIRKELDNIYKSKIDSSFKSFYLGFIINNFWVPLWNHLYLNISNFR